VFCIGRLDRDSEGLILMTNDGRLAFRLAHPRYEVERAYEVVVGGPAPSGLAMQLKAGVELEDGIARARSVEVVGPRGKDAALRLILTEGRKREVRRMLASCGLEVKRLKRVRFGAVILGRLAPGAWRALTRDEVRALRRLVGESSPRSRGSRRRTKPE
jgi:23S rRNA pseudouridine2605 synthase